MKSNFPTITHPHQRVIWTVAIHFSVRLQVIISHSLHKEMMIAVFEFKVTLLAGIIAEQWMKKVKDHKVMDPELLLLLERGVRVRVRLKGGNNSCMKLMIKLGGGGSKFVEVNTPPSGISCLLVEEKIINP